MKINVGVKSPDMEERQNGRIGGWKLYMKKEWLNPLFRCAETLYVIDEDTKELLWLNGHEVNDGRCCWQSLMHGETPCSFCPHTLTEDVYTCDGYDQNSKRWFKLKQCAFYDEERLLRACNLDELDDTMDLSLEGIQEISSLQALLRDNKRMKAALEKEMSHDRMTGLRNRNRFNLDISTGIYDSAGTGALYFDLNNLKIVNDQSGHEAGDRLICHLAKAIFYVSKKYTDAMSYRIGGDEFIILFQNTNPESLKAAQKDFYDFMDKQSCKPACITAVGIAYSEKAQNAEQLVSRADHAMYEDKRRLKEKDLSGEHASHYT